MPSDQCWVLTSWWRWASSFKSSKWWVPLYWSGCLLKCVSWRPCVFTKQNLLPLALQSKYNPKAICSCCAPAASVLPALVMSMSHHFEEVLELPMVMEDKVEGDRKTKKVVLFLNDVRLGMTSKKISISLWMRVGLWKVRNRWHSQRREPWITYNEDNIILKAFRNLPGFLANALLLWADSMAVETLII